MPSQNTTPTQDAVNANDVANVSDTVSSDVLNDTYTTSSGYLVEFQNITNLIAKLASQFPEPERPTYQVKTAGGPVETHPHDKTTLETDADREAWAAYEFAVAKHARDFFAAQVRLSLLRGIKVLNADDKKFSAWVDEQVLIGFAVPTEPGERKLHWLQTEVAPTNEDVISIVAGVARHAGIPEEAVTHLESSFRGALGRAQRKIDNRTKDSANEQGLVHPKSVRGNGRRTALGNHKHQSVGRNATR